MKIFVILIFIFTLSNAHKLNLFTNFEDNKLFISSYFASGKACRNCEIKIIKIDKVLLKAKTNSRGEYETTINENIFKISVDAGSGHIVSKNIKNESAIKIEASNNRIKVLEEENKKLKLQVSLLEEKVATMDIFKMIFALVCIFGIFMFLKRVKK